ncbi:Alpha/Beta hydrolase protein [Schizophyllum amplum]|uniref:Alpha/Beta hydrolase protein n=1 Tax=Schizophyllum amplum TaxID=97359 RepID=A0A550CL82_9AGAR|nr:Alpha/Beta hydrolase protein [Auriculariopsis ampla]
MDEEPMTLGTLVGKLIRHGQYLLVYPYAYTEGRDHVYSPAEIGLFDPVEDLRLPTPDGVELQAYLFRKPLHSSASARFTIIMFHGNAMNLGEFTHVAQYFVRRRYNVLVMSYRGYAKSTGKPTQKGLRIDAQTALDFVRNDPQLSQTRVVLYGLSLGGAVAIDLASRNSEKLAGLIIENTFLSLPAVVSDWPYLGRLSWAVHQRWNSAARMRRISRALPICMMSGQGDTVVPPRHLKGLWEIAKERGLDKKKGVGKTKGEKEGHGSSGTKDELRDEFHEFAFGHHHDTHEQPGYWKRIDAFMDRLKGEKTRPLSEVPPGFSGLQVPGTSRSSKRRSWKVMTWG